MKSYVPLLITLPPNLVADLDQVSEALEWTRMALICRCIIRDMQYVIRCPPLPTHYASSQLVAFLMGVA